MELLHNLTLELIYAAANTMAEGTKVCTRLQFEHYVRDFKVIISSFRHSCWAMTLQKKGGRAKFGLAWRQEVDGREGWRERGAWRLVTTL